MFRPGLWACIACSLASILIVLILSFYFYLMNRKADREGIVLEDEPDSEASLTTSIPKAPKYLTAHLGPRGI